MWSKVWIERLRYIGVLEKNRERSNVLMPKICFRTVFALTLLTATNSDAQTQERCLIPPSGYADLHLGKDPVDFPELGINIGLASEGF